jgi:hypothetical protein
MLPQAQPAAAWAERKAFWMGSYRKRLRKKEERDEEEGVLL